jgi:hypothetical protein
MRSLQRTLDELGRMWAVALPRFKDFAEHAQRTPSQEHDLG